LIDALLARTPRPKMTWDLQYADAREAYDLATGHVGAGSTYQLRAAQTLAYVLVNRGGSKRSAADRAEEAFKVLEEALTAARSSPAIKEGNVDLLNAEARYGALLCTFRSVDEGMRRLWEVAGLGRKHHGDDSLPVELAYYQLGECLWERDDPEAVWLKADAYRMAEKRGEHSEGVLAMLANDVATLHCNAGRAVACAEFSNKASIHASAIPAEKIRSQALSSIGVTQARALILRGKADEAEALASQLLIDPRCCEQGLHMVRSEALRLNGRFEDAVLAADKAISIARSKRVNSWELATHLATRGMAELELNHPAQALTALDEAMSMTPTPDVPTFEGGWASRYLAYGRALLANNRTAEALEPLRQSYGLWLGQDANSVWAAEAKYWFGRAWIANGEGNRGRRMVAEARKALQASPLPLHRALAAQADRITITMGTSK
jgi:tetratricopeptide (TPR) repeat protein